MTADEQTVALLQGIWNEMKLLNGRIDHTREDLGARIDQTNARLDQTNARLDETITRLDRLSTRVDAGFARMDQRFDHLLLGEHGHEHKEFRERIARLEERTGLAPIAP